MIRFARVTVYIHRECACAGSVLTVPDRNFAFYTPWSFAPACTHRKFTVPGACSNWQCCATPSLLASATPVTFHAQESLPQAALTSGTAIGLEGEQKP